MDIRTHEARCSCPGEGGDGGAASPTVWAAWLKVLDETKTNDSTPPQAFVDIVYRPRGPWALPMCSDCCGRVRGSLAEHVRDRHMSEILPTLFLGGAHNAANLCELQSRQIRCVVNVANELRCLFPETIAYERAYWSDRDTQAIGRDLHRLCDAIHRRVLANENVLVHCFAGMSRAPTLVVAYLLKYGAEGKMFDSVDAALRFVHSKRPVVAPNRGFMMQLHAFHQARGPLLDSSRLLP